MDVGVSCNSVNHSFELRDTSCDLDNPTSQVRVPTHSYLAGFGLTGIVYTLAAKCKSYSTMLLSEYDVPFWSVDSYTIA